jgi:acetyl esterase/lipase
LIPEGAENDRVLLYLHGGWFVVGSIESHRKMVARIAAAAGCRALIIDYRLAPEHQFPAALEDSLSAYRWLLAEGYRPDRTVIAGDSAGGGLTASTLVSLRDMGDPMPAAAVMLSPMTDLLLLGDSVKTKAKEDPFVNETWCRKCIGMYLGGTDPKEPLASPLYADLKGLPPILIQVGSREILLDDSVRFADHARQDGVSVELDVWDGMFHVWQINGPQMPESMDAIQKLGDYCRDKMAAGN